MKKTVVLLLAVSLVFAACKDDKDYKVGPGKLEVTVKLPTEYSKYDKSTIEVILESVVSSETKQTKKADVSGLITFTDIVPGTYKISASASGTYSDFNIQKPGNFKLIGSENNVLIKGDLVEKIDLELVASDAGGLVISEFYYNYTWTESGDPYLEDQYIHIYNNSEKIIYADGLIIGNCSLILKNPEINYEDFVYIAKAFKIPGTGKEHPIKPGKFLVLANDGMDHTNDENGNPGRSIDLSGADFEFWTHDNGAFNEDIDYENVPNLEQIYFNDQSWDWMPHNSHPILVIFRTNEFDSYEKVNDDSDLERKVVKVPVTTVIDGFEGQEEIDDEEKHLPSYIINNVFSQIETGWLGLVCKRKVLKTVNGVEILQNTRNNDEDFETYEIYPGSSTEKKLVNSEWKSRLHPEKLKMLREISNSF